ncbi:1,4-alpha-glucan branching enzyme [Poseidonocella pacifica]|uniref:1,4-alpha-glucan branching enzyme GlgB n=1 Tax=Poseidonocella pacifica TaxID=871651 RepID=A0A1I0VIB7_9RHOB|nr:1,4-alpha-glucan branching protein GlgB [Poseidonocella pacifica]SFA75306.1 1,4-alpha-glucan branching enzyme [Poseidonocella pacifica]
MDKANADPARLPVSQTDLTRIREGRHDDPFRILGPHQVSGTRHVLTFQPGATQVTALVGDSRHPLSAVTGHEGLFWGPVPGDEAYRFAARAENGAEWELEDPYRFGPIFTDFDEYLLGEGRHKRLWEVLGAHVREHEGVMGTHFAVWAPNAQRVSVVGDFNFWNGRQHVMRRRGATGIWEIFLPGVLEGAAYKYEIIGKDGVLQPLKADPVGFGSQHPPANASVVRDLRGYGWDDGQWMSEREARQARTSAISVYEVHLGSWRRKEGGRPISYVEAAQELVDYAVDMGFTHLELMPISEFPFDGSWGYQPVGMFAPTVRFGPPHEFRDLVDAAHAKGLGIILDWVPGHFPTDPHGLGRFDGTSLYEHSDPREGFHNDWNTFIYNYGRTEVQNYLAANALYWLEEYHVDGLRVDAVASMLYRDYSREDGQWVPNKDGGRENYEAISLLQRVNTETYSENPGIMTIAEESTSYPKVSAPVHEGGLGFGYKWNMGWMNDTLEYIKKDPIHRKYHHNQMTFGLHYAFSENFILPISHDEVVHGKGSLLSRMPGNEWERFANMRTYYGFMWGHPGKKLLFMGQEFAQPSEWNHDEELPWHLLQDPAHEGMQRLVRDLNTLYRGEPALHYKDAQEDGFRWIEGGDSERSVFAWLRRGGPEDAQIAVLCNFTPMEQPAYQIGLPFEGKWAEVLNTDAGIYGGGNRGNMGGVTAVAGESHGMPARAKVVIPPLSAVYLRYEGS